jgi:hypothetical protein
MFEDGRIRSSLIWDESKLNNTRTCVAWLSPNHWHNGSLYGNIEFDFDWKTLVEGKEFYWVEAIKKYNPHAFRILITDKDLTTSLEPYLVDDGNGPLFHDSLKDEWYWNGNLTGEFMIDEDLPLSACETVSFVNHNQSICRKDGPSCRDMKQAWDDAGTKLLARLVAQNVIKSSNKLRRLFLDGEKLHFYANSVVEGIIYKVSKLPTTGSVKHQDRVSAHIASALLDRLGNDRKLDALASLFNTAKDLETAVRKRIAKAVGIPIENIPDLETL